jgi:hypothetical protein
MAHQHDRPVAPAAGRQPRRHTIAEGFMREIFTRDPRRIEPDPQPIADGIDAAFVVAAGIDVHEICQQGHHCLMLPAEMFENGVLCLDAHGCSDRISTRGSNHRANTSSDSTFAQV